MVTVDCAKAAPESVRTARAATFMTIRPLLASLCASLDDFLAQPLDIVDGSRTSAVAILDANQPVLVATLVNVDRLNESSRLGRIFSEQIAGRMVQRGLRVTEVKLRESLVLHRDQGELLLSREAREVSQAQNAQAVVVGTYAMSASMLYLSLKLVNPMGNH
eukprot:gene40397-64290_t